MHGPRRSLGLSPARPSQRRGTRARSSSASDAGVDMWEHAMDKGWDVRSCPGFASVDDVLKHYRSKRH